MSQSKSSYAPPLRSGGRSWDFERDEAPQRGWNTLQPTGSDLMWGLTSQEEATPLMQSPVIPQGFSGSISTDDSNPALKLSPTLLVALVTLFLA